MAINGERTERGNWDFYVGADGHWYLRRFGFLQWRSPWYRPDGWWVAKREKKAVLSPQPTPRTLECRMKIFGFLRSKARKRYSMPIDDKPFPEHAVACPNCRSYDLRIGTRKDEAAGGFWARLMDRIELHFFGPRAKWIVICCACQRVWEFTEEPVTEAVVNQQESQ